MRVTIETGQRRADSCKAVSEILARVGDKWSVLIVVMLGGGPRRFNELKRSIGGISQRMLTLSLRGLERDGLVTRTPFPTIPPRVDYELTPLGRSLWEPLKALGDWVQVNQPAIERARMAFDITRQRQQARPVGATGPGSRTATGIEQVPRLQSIDARGS